MRKGIFPILLLLISYCSIYAHALISPEILPANNLTLTEDCRIRVVNAYRGEISVSTSNGKTWFKVGQVLQPSAETNPQGYTASKWSRIGCVAATAVNAIHIKTGINVTGDYGVVFSLLPKDLLQAPRNYTSYLSPDASIYTNIMAGQSIFGGGYSPFVGNPIYLEQKDKSLIPIPINYKPAVADVILIKVLRPDPMPEEMIFENKFGGKITLKYYNKEPEIIGEVLRPVAGAGRFLGSQYTYPGRIRANHSGVLDIATAPKGLFGGFQIIPADHGMSSEMITARIKSQWMVVGPAKVGDSSFENRAPLYSYFFRPSYNKSDFKGDDWMQKTLRRYLVQIKYRDQEDGEWDFIKPVSYRLDKELPESAFKALDNIAEIRILFPIL